MVEQQGAGQEASGKGTDSQTLLERLQRSEEVLERLCAPGAPSFPEEASAALRQEVAALRQMRGELGKLLERGALLADTSHRLLNLPPEEMESGIRAALALLGQHVHAQRCYVGLLSDDGNTLTDAYEWCEPGTEPYGLEKYRGGSTTRFSWSLRQFQAGKTVTVKDPSMLPPEAAAERGAAAARGVRAYVNTPLSLGGRLVGWMGFDAVGAEQTWTPEELHLLGLTGRALVTALERKRRDTLLLQEKEQEQRARSLGIVAAGLAHEINNPLAYTTGNLEYLKQRLPCPHTSEAMAEECQQVLSEALEGAGRIRRIVADLGSLSLRDAGEEEPVDFRAVIESTLRMADNQLRHRAPVVREYGPPLPRVRGTTTKLGQVVLNLLLNAAHAIPEGRYSENRITVALRAEGEGAVLALSDTGRGIPADVLPRIFDPFFTTRRVGGGMGMGLAICRDIITALGGRIGVQSQPGQGTTVEVYLPRAAEHSEPEARVRTVAPPSSGKRLLAVDDEPRVLDLLRRLLKGHELVTAANGRQALERLREDREFDLILCDLMMPELTGLDVYGAVRETWPGLHERIVFITGGAFTPETQRFLQQVKNPLLTKPFEPAQLRELVANANGRLAN
ncbi:ATP-binding protein [Pyxidicoccus sp. 3LG]